MIDINFGHVLQMFSFDDHEFNHVLVARSIAKSTIVGPTSRN